MNTSASKRGVIGNTGSKEGSTKITMETLNRENSPNYLQKYSDVKTVTIHPTMLCLLLPNTFSKAPTEKDDRSIEVNYVDVNHNDPNMEKGYEIMNNAMDNPFKVPNPYKGLGVGKDGEILMLNFTVSGLKAISCCQNFKII